MPDGIPYDKLTAPVLLGIAVLLVIFGRLVPWYIYKEKAKECDTWRKAFEAEREARVTSDAQTVELLEVARTTKQLVSAIFDTTERTRRAGEAGVVQTAK